RQRTHVLGWDLAYMGALFCCATWFRAGPRHTQDADVMAEPFPGRESAFLARLGGNYYVPAQALRDANRDRSSFNVIHTPTAFKVDVFIQKDRSFDRSALQRRGWREVRPGPDGALRGVEPEDSILFAI